MERGILLYPTGPTRVPGFTCLTLRKKKLLLENKKIGFSNTGVKSMPIYEFECEQCRHRFERLIFPSEDGQPSCPKCDGEKARKLMSACSNVTLKIPAGYGGGAKPPACAPGG